MGHKSDTEALSAAGLTLDQRQATDGTPEFHVAGETHLYRNALRHAGGNWNKLKRVWTFAGDNPLAGIAAAIRDQPANRDRGLGDSAAGNKPHYWGHRQRLRDRFMTGDAKALPDYELLELLLFNFIARVDVKPLAKQLIERFGSLGGVLAAEPERLAELDQVSYATIVMLKAVGAAGLRLAREEIAERPVLRSWDKLIAYRRAGMAHDSRERFQVLFLNAKNAVIADEVQQQGTVDHTPVYPREVIKRALELGAMALIMVHNHPSGDPTPIQADIDMTQEVADAAETLGIVLHDHIIISRHGHTSFKEMGLL